MEKETASLDKDCIIDLVPEKSALVTHADSIKDINKQFIIILFYSILFVTALGLSALPVCLSVFFCPLQYQFPVRRCLPLGAPEKVAPSLQKRAVQSLSLSLPVNTRRPSLHHFIFCFDYGLVAYYSCFVNKFKFIIDLESSVGLIFGCGLRT